MSQGTPNLQKSMAEVEMTSRNCPKFVRNAWQGEVTVKQLGSSSEASKNLLDQSEYGAKWVGAH
jgi:hypothetical protein